MSEEKKYVIHVQEVKEEPKDSAFGLVLYTIYLIGWLGSMILWTNATSEYSLSNFILGAVVSAFWPILLLFGLLK